MCVSMSAIAGHLQPVGGLINNCVSSRDIKSVLEEMCVKNICGKERA